MENLENKSKAELIEEIKSLKSTNEHYLIRQKLVSEAANIAYWDFNITDWKYDVLDSKVYWSQEFRAMLGFTDENDFPNIFGSWKSRLHANDVAHVDSSLLAHLNDYTGETPYNVKYRFMMKSGEYRIFRSYGSALRDEKGTPTKIAGVIKDITKQELDKIVNKATDEQIRILFDLMPIACSLWSKDIQPILCNKEALKMYGVEDEDRETYYKEYHRFSPEYQPCGILTSEMTKEVMVKAFETGYQRFNWMHQDINGEPIPCEVTLIRVEYEGDYRIAAYDRDLREQKKLEQEVAENNEFIHTVFKNSPIGLTVFDEKFKFLDCNDGVLKIYGISKEEYSSFFGSPAHSPEFQPDGSNSLEKTMKIIKNVMDGNTEKIEWVHLMPDGQPLPVELTMVRTIRNGEYIVLGYIYDMREQKEMLIKIQEEQAKTKALAHWYESILDAIPLPISVTDDETKWTFGNKALENFLGTKRHDIMGKLCSNWGATICNTNRCGIECAKRGEKRTFFNHDGHSYQVDVEILKNLNDKTAGYIEIVQDITTLMAMEREQKELAHWYKSILNAIPFPVLVTDMHMNLTFVNSCAEKAVGHENSEIKGKHCRLWGTPNCDTERCGIVQAQRGVYRTFYKKEDMSCQVDIEILKDLNGNHSGFVKLVQDITKVEEMARQQADAENKAKSAFLAQMSHEIRTPMNAIMGIAQIELQKKNLNEAHTAALEKIFNSGEILLGIINDILDMSKIEMGKLELHPIEYDLASMINDAIQLNIVRIGAKPIKFILDINENLPHYLFGDELRLKQILNNLLSNAIKYTKEGTVKLSIDYMFEHTEEGDEKVILRFVISDTGQGMKPDDLDNLFSEYTRFDNNTTRNIEGTGLGLSIAKQLVEMMDGSIEVQSEYGKGSIFMVSVKQTPTGFVSLGADIVKSLLDFTYREDVQSEKLNITYVPMPYAKVLVVDDVEINIYVVQGMLGPYELQVESAISGFVAIEKVQSKQEPYDIIFMDHMMPLMDGMQATKKLRNSGYKGIIVALTANALAGNEEMFMKNGFDGFISKPIDIHKLDACLKKFVYRPELEKDTKHEQKPICTSKDKLSNDKILKIFRRDAVKAVKALHETIANNDTELFTITAHAMKSALANIGEHEASELALSLEKAGQNKDIEFILGNYKRLIENLQNMINQIPTEALSDNNDDINEETELLIEKLKVLKEACEDYDRKAAYVELDLLKQKQWKAATIAALEEIYETLSLHSDFEGAQEKVSALIGKICLTSY